MKKIICLLISVLLIGCSDKKEEATITETYVPTQTPLFQMPIPTPMPPGTPTPIPTPTPTPLIIPETLDDVDFSKESLSFLCPKGKYYGYFENLEEPYISLTLNLYSSDGIYSMWFVLEGTSGRFFKGIFNKIDKDFYSYYGYTFTSEERQEDYQGTINIVFDESFIRYFKYQDGYIYIYPDGLTMEEMYSYQFVKEDGCKFVYEIID